MSLSESNNLQGFLPNEISALYTIASIILFDNRIISTIPTGIGNLTRLELLDIEACNFTDSLFTEDVLKLTELVALRASFNEFNNSIPAEISSLSHLKQLWAADNQLSGELPTQMAQLTSLGTLSRTAISARFIISSASLTIRIAPTLQKHCSFTRIVSGATSLVAMGRLRTSHSFDCTTIRLVEKSPPTCTKRLL